MTGKPQKYPVNSNRKLIVTLTALRLKIHLALRRQAVKMDPVSFSSRVTRDPEVRRPNGFLSLPNVRVADDLGI